MFSQKFKFNKQIIKSVCISFIYTLNFFNVFLQPLIVSDNKPGMTNSKSIHRYVPNTVTALNLLSGVFSMLFCFEGYLLVASLFIFLAAVFDFFDGFLARLLNAYSDLGKQLDSLADIVSFGVAPTLLLYRVFQMSFEIRYGIFSFESLLIYEKIMLFTPVFITIASAFRLAKFNIDPDQSDTFLGLPTPANAIFFASVSLILQLPGNPQLTEILLNPWLLFILITTMSLLMVSCIPMFSIKFDNWGLKENLIRYAFIGISVIFVIIMKLVALPIIIIFYVLLSISVLLFKKYT